MNAFASLTCKNQKAAGMLRPLENVGLADGAQTIGYLNINCADAAGGLTVKITPGGQKLTLKDNGKKRDLAANDGIYSAKWTPAATGTYTFTFSNGDVQKVKVT